MEIREAIKEIKDTLQVSDRKLCLVTRISEMINKKIWNSFGNLRKVLNCVTSLCRLHESIIYEQFPTKHKERTDNIYGNINK